MKKKTQPGFLLFESLIYLSLIAILSFIVIPFFQGLSQRLWIYNNNCLASIRFNNVKDLLVRDLMFASNNPSHWDDQQLSFIHEAIDENGIIDRKLIRWLNNERGVKRSVQNYNPSKSRFNRQGVNAFSGSLYNLTFDLMYDKEQRHVVCVVVSYSTTKHDKARSLKVRLLSKEITI